MIICVGHMYCLEFCSFKYKFITLHLKTMINKYINYYYYIIHKFLTEQKNYNRFKLKSSSDTLTAFEVKFTNCTDLYF